MREFKFRVWSFREAEMGKRGMWKGVYSSYEGQSLNEFIKECQEIGLILMQYTGLKDMNGKEIYEGDILRWYPQKGKNYTDVVVRYLVSSARFYLGDWYENDFPDTEKHSLVIGNIYENPGKIRNEERR